MSKDLKSYETLHLNKKGKVSDKWSSYFEIYDKLLTERRHKSGDLLEIGVQNGGSLEIWAEYFKDFRTITGCDIDEKCRQLKFADQRIHLVIDDATNPTSIPRLLKLSDGWNIIVDDGSHLPFDIIRSFLLLFPLLRPGGIYIIEDTHVCYGDVPGGSVINPLSIFQFFKQLTDIINKEFWSTNHSWEKLFKPFFQNSSPPEILDGAWIRSLEFYNSIIVINKETSPKHSKLGNRHRNGSEMQVQDWKHINQS
jgi:hypothetical protein